MGTVSKTLNIVANTTYNLAIDLWSWSIWATEAGITTTYSSLANLLADEKAVRQLMLVHKSVDYLANYPSGADRETLNTIINSDICAKWINLSDYALYTLATNTNIKSVMDTADKYFYGEWGKVGIASKGTATASAGASGYEAYHAFTPIGADAGWYISGAAYTNAWLKCDLGVKTKITDVITYIQAIDSTPTMTITFSGSDDDITYTPIKTGIVAHTTKEITALDAPVNYRYYKWEITAFTGSSSNTSGFKTNLVSWSPLGNIPIMTSNSAPYGTARSSGAYSGSEAYKAFDGNSSTFFMTSTYDASSNFWVSYKAVNPIKPKKAYVQLFNTDGTAATTKFKIQGSNDGFASDINDVSAEITCTVGASTVIRPYDPVEVDITTDAYYMEYRIIRTYTSIETRFNVVTFQLYGRELKPLVPTMTSNTTPKGEASMSPVAQGSAYYAFDGNDSTKAAAGVSGYIRYKFANSVCVKRVYTYTANTGTRAVSLQGSNNGTTFTSIKSFTTNSTTPKVCIDAENTNYYQYYQIIDTDNDNLSFYTLQFYGFDYSEKEFASGSTRKTIYDHGVTPSGAITGGTKNPDCLTLSAVGTATITIDKGTRKYMGGKAGLHASGTNRLKCGSGYSNFTTFNMPDSNGFDISSISGSVAIGIEQTASGTFDCTEIWIE